MKNKTGVIGGFAFGIIGFLLLFKVIFLDNIPQEDELAPGIVVLASILNGALFSFVGFLIQNRFTKQETTNEKMY